MNKIKELTCIANWKTGMGSVKYLSPEKGSPGREVWKAHVSWKIIFFITNHCITHVSNAGNWCRKKFVVGLAIVLPAVCDSWYKWRSLKFKITSSKGMCWKVGCYSFLVPAVHYSMFCCVSEFNVLITFTRPNTNNFNLTEFISCLQLVCQKCPLFVSGFFTVTNKTSCFLH